MSLITSEEDPYNRDFSALIQKVKDGDGEWISAVLGGPLQKLNEEMSSISSSLEPIIASVASPELQLDNKSEEMYSQSTFKVEEVDLPFNQDDETWTTTEFSTIRSQPPLSTSEESSNTWEAEGEVQDEEAQYADAWEQPPTMSEPRSLDVDQAEASTNLTEEDTEFIALRRLGYARQEIAGLKESVRRLITVNQVNRPAGPLPKEWQKVSSMPPRTSTKQVQKKRRQQEQQQQQQPQSPQQTEEGLSSRAVRWAGINLNDDNEAEIELDPALIEGRERAIEEARAFWPSRDEFKDLLLSESKWRLGLLGNWIAPAVRQETKWRYDAYNGFKTFLEGGFGDTFDVVDEDFGDDEDGTVDGTLHQHATPPHDTANNDFTERKQPRQQAVQRTQQQQQPKKKKKKQAPQESNEDMKRRRYDEYLDKKRNELRTVQAEISNGDDSEDDESILPEDKDAWFSNQSSKKKKTDNKPTRSKRGFFAFLDDNDDDDFEIDADGDIDERNFGDEQIERSITKRAIIPNNYLLQKQPSSPSKSSRTLRTQEEFEAAWKASAQRAKVEDYPPTRAAANPDNNAKNNDIKRQQLPRQKIKSSTSIKLEEEQLRESTGDSPRRSRRPRWEETDNI